MIELKPFAKLGGADHGWLKTFHTFSFAMCVDLVAVILPC